MATKPSYNHLKSQLRSFGRLQRGVAGLICLGLAYALALQALDTGSWWEYGASLVLIIVGFRYVLGAVKPAKK